MTNKTPIAMPAEWAPVEAVVLALPHPDTDWAPMLDQVLQCYANMAAAILPSAPLIVVKPTEGAERLQTQFEAKLTAEQKSRITYVAYDTDDTWARDICPITVKDGDGNRLFCDFAFNGWGNKFGAERDNALNETLCRQWSLKGQRIDCLDFVLEGGSIESDGRGTILTTARCLLSPERNPKYTRGEIEQRLCRQLGAQRVLWLEHGALVGDDTDSHVDTLARLVPNDTIVYTAAGDDADDEQYTELKAMQAELEALCTADGRPYTLVALPLPKAVHDADDQHRLPATYANFLIVNNTVIVPKYAQPDLDQQAISALRQAFEGYKIIGVDCTALIRQHGSLHCASMQIPS